MESRTVLLAQNIIQLEDDYNNYLDKKVFINDRSVINFLTTCLFFFGSLLVISNLQHPLTWLISFLIGYPLIGYLSMKYLEFKKAYKGIKANNFLGCRIKSFNKKGINFETLGMDAENSLKFKNLLSGNMIQGKVYFKAPNKSKLAANHGTLFTILNHVAYNGIRNISKKALFVIINENILIAGKSINPGSYSVSYSLWINEKDEKKLYEREVLLKKIFHNH
ncbi:hypothetical protein [uncultured Polaribacter sp.]|uniref:hypothetical protein n=1 Tax=uncultured Polaribacter sp. TaxID=174711 RepID=UPI002611AE1C|nr:hypothetical protein [uncultured Polaribacter sp.]